MSNFCPPDTPTLTPYLAVQDAARSIAFYESAFGLSLMFKHEMDNRIVHAQMGLNGQQLVMFAPENAFGMTAKAPATTKVEAPFSMYVYVANVDRMHEKAIAAGCTSHMAPDNTFWGDRYCQVEDINGYRWGFASVLTSPGHQLSSAY